MMKHHIAEVRSGKFIGKCIYCHATEDLHDEHCIPESLNGFHVLEKGSCAACGKITGRFESDYARKSMLSVRTAWNMRSKRSKKKRPTEFPMRFVKNGKEEIINVPVEDHYSVIPLVELGPPGRYRSLENAKGLKHGQYQLHPFRIRPDEHIHHLVEKYGADEMSVDFHIDVVGFLRMIAKIAYCMVVWKYGLNAIAEAYVVPAILGTKTDIWEWVGSDGSQEVHEQAKNMKTDHVVTHWFTEDGELHSKVKLFKKSFTPEYHVIVGRLTPAVYGLYQSLGRV